MPRKSLTLLLILGFVLLNSNSIAVAQTYENEDIRIECNPESTTLSPGERTTIEISITNLNNNTEYIEIEYISTEEFGLTQGTLSEDRFSLLPDETKIVSLLLIASSSWFHSENANDGLLELKWATDDVKEGNDNFPYIYFVGHSTTIDIEVTKNMTLPIIIFAFVTIIATIIVVVVVKKHRKKTA